MFKNKFNEKWTRRSVEQQTECDFNSAKLIEAAEELRFAQLKSGVLPPNPLNRPTLELTRQFFNVLNFRESLVLLQWPMFQRDLSMIHSIAVLSSFMPQELVESRNYVYCNPLKSFRTLFFPWFSGRTRAIQQSILVDRNTLLEWNQRHLTRSMVKKSSTNGGIDGAMEKLHETIAHLRNLQKRDSTKPYLAHPTLAEVYPLFRLEEDEVTHGAVISKKKEIFDRISFGALLEIQTDHRSEISNPGIAPFGFFAVTANSDPRRLLAAPEFRENPPDICLLDLNSAAMNRLGPDWSAILQKFVKECNKRFPNMPFLGLTNSTFYLNSAAKLLSAKGVSYPRKSITVRLSTDPITEEQEISELSRIHSLFKVFAGDLSHSVSELMDAAKSMENANLAEIFRMKIGSIRKAASLPCGFSDSYEILLNSYGQATAELFLDTFSASTVLNHISEVIDETGGNQRMKVKQAHTSVDLLYKKLDRETPMGSLLQNIVDEISEKSGRTIIVFNSKYAETIGKHRLLNAPTNGRKIGQLLEAGRMQFTDEQNFEKILQEITKSSQQEEWNRILLVAPRIQWLSKILVEQWLPAEFIVLCEKYFALNVSREYEQLSKFREMTEYSTLIDRFESIYNAAKSEADMIDAAVLDFEIDSRQSLESAEKEIDLTDVESDSETEIIEFSLESNRTLKVRPASRIIRVSENAIDNKFERKSANEIEIGNIIIVPDELFILQAREILPIQVMSINFVNYYHDYIEIKLPQIPGDNLTEKATYLLRKIQSKEATTTSVATVKNWLNVEKHQQLDPEVRRSNAPQNWKTFSAFMSELDLDPGTTEKIWEIGIQSFRTDRRRAGQKLANAYNSVLIDPHGTVFGLDKEMQESINEFRLSALENAEEIVSINRSGIR